jgi:hypothetical protein
LREDRESCSRFALPTHTMQAGVPVLVTSTATTGDEGPSQTTTHYPSSVAFLLSDDYEQVFSKFNFPEPTSPQESVQRRTTSWRDAYSGSAGTPFRGLDDDFLNSVLNFDFFPLSSRGPSTRCASVEPQGVTTATDEANFKCTADDVDRLLSRVLTARTISLLDEHARVEVRQQMHSLCHPTCVTRFVAHYFNIWHRNCRIVHRPSFSLDVCHEALVLAVIFLGAMYSSEPMERVAASAVIEHLESYIFACLPSKSLGKEHRVGDTNVASENEHDFQIVQAAFLMVITLFWTGTETQKRRAASHLFDVVVEVSAVQVHWFTVHLSKG